MGVGKVGVDYRYFFAVRTGSGAPRTGAAASITVTVRDPANTVSSTPSVTEVAGGLYFVDVPNAFTTANGAGQYGIVAEVTVAPFDTGGDVIDFFDSDLDDLALEATAQAILLDTGTTIPGTIATLQADTDDIQTRLPATLNGGRMRSHVEAMDAATIAAGVWTAAAIQEIADLLETGGTNPHGTGSWVGSSAQDWTATEREQIRFRLAMDGSQTDPTTGVGTVEDILTDTSVMEPLVVTNLDATISGVPAAVDVVITAAHGAGSYVGGAVVSAQVTEIWQRLGLDIANAAVNTTATETVDGSVKVPASGAVLDLVISKAGPVVTVTRI